MFYDKEVRFYSQRYEEKSMMKNGNQIYRHKTKEHRLFLHAFLFIANSHFLRTAGPHFPDGSGHIKRTAWEISRAEGTPPY
ncbi:hypothetical protein, partial [Bilifractor sp. HCP3S3_D3]|uniref:hypothetical protein n=1 Tax=Bilifractor sp. HCP3S3_D3 TaxID=3438907 RepID=UPI003F8BB7E7